MKKILLRILIVLTLVCLFSWTVFADYAWVIYMSSEWEATGFNNGVRFVRDSNGYFHAFWHSQVDWNKAPSGRSSDIFYSYTTVPAVEPPSMANEADWATPVNLTTYLYNKDNRYPAAAIEYECYSGDWMSYNQIQVVWQAILPGQDRYEILYAKIPVTNPPSTPAAWTSAKNLSNTPGTDSLVPAIAINNIIPISNRISMLSGRRRTFLIRRFRDQTKIVCTVISPISVAKTAG
jgi:hypothetical protein